MTWLILASLVLFAPVSGVVSGGRFTGFSMKTGLIPEGEWKYVAGLPAVDTGTFSSVSFQGGYNSSFRVVSSGETAGVDPLIASCVSEDGYAAQMQAGDFSVLVLNYAGAESYAFSCGGATLDFRGSSHTDISPAVEYAADNFLAAGTCNSVAAGFSLAISEAISAGPAYCEDRSGGDFWLMARASTGPLEIVMAPAVNENTCYRRIHSSLKFFSCNIVYGWDGAERFGEFSVCRNNFIASVSLDTPGFMIAIEPVRNLLAVTSHRSAGWFQGEILGKYRCITAGTDILRSPGGMIRWGLSLGIDMGNSDITDIFCSSAMWSRQMAVTPLLN